MKGIMDISFESGRNVFYGRQARARGKVSTGDSETGTVHDSCDLLSSLSGHIVVSSFVCALSDFRFICVTAFLLATYGVLNSELTNCPPTAAVVVKTIWMEYRTCQCERVLYRHRAILLILRVRRGSCTRRFRPHGDDDRDRGDEENGQKVETLEREEEVKARGDNARSDTW